ncbi:MAG TPA: DUF1080 domain-containing protein [Candidatus Limnocylindrales bacterium]|jgi:hypothetical protein|nr:DUF1080 domain-containing protein [Candidatus Limnocylindrales bacterium]
MSNSKGFSLGGILVVTTLALLAGCAKPSPEPPVVEATAPHESQPAPAAVTAPTPPTTAAPDVLKEAAAKPSEPFENDDWELMFDGKTLKGWRETQFAGHGEVQCRDGLIVLNMGDPFTGINWTNDFPTMNYEVALDAMRVMGTDFFCGLTVPVGNSFCSLIVGGWGGSLIGISSFNGMDASENETTKFVGLEPKRWYRIRLRVVEGRIQGWLDQEKLIDVDTAGKRISLRPGDIEMSKPFGLASWQTTSALREIRMRRVSEPEKSRK